MNIFGFSNKFVGTLKKGFVVYVFASLFFIPSALLADTTANLTSSGATINTSACPAFSTSGDYCLLTGPLGTFFSDGKVHIRANGLADYLNSLYKIGVAAATGLALIYITMGGVRYASTDAVTGKDEGRGMISNALLGLMIVLGSYIILNAINPDLLNNNLVLTHSVNLPTVSGNTSGLVIANDGGTSGYVTQPDGTVTFNGKTTQYRLDGDGNLVDESNNPVLNSDGSKARALGPVSTSVGEANQKILSKIQSGATCTKDNCFTSAEAFYNSVGYKPETAYQSNNYVVGGNTLPKTIGTARMPVPGEMVDYRFYTGSDHDDPFHSVIVYSNNGNGNYDVWDWHHSANSSTGLRNVTLNLDSPGAVGYIGRIYTPQ